MATSARFTDVKTVSAETAARWQDRSIPAMGEGKRGQQCYTVDGCAFWSYSTCIAVVDHATHTLVFSTTRYSTTTNRFARMLRYELPRMFLGYWVFECDPGVFHVQPDTLLSLGKGQEVEGHIGDPVDSLIDVEDRLTIHYMYGMGSRRLRNRSTLI